MYSIAPNFHDQTPSKDNLTFVLTITITRSIVELKLNKKRVSILEIKRMSKRANLKQLALDLKAVKTKKVRGLVSIIQSLLIIPAVEPNVVLIELNSLL